MRIAPLAQLNRYYSNTESETNRALDQALLDQFNPRDDFKVFALSCFWFWYWCNADCTGILS